MNTASQVIHDAPLEPAATTSERRPDARLLVLNRTDDSVVHSSLRHLADHLRAGDLLVVNDAATIPASLSGCHEPTGAAVELRLLVAVDAPSWTGRIPSHWQAVAFGAGDWHQPTEQRPMPPLLQVGEHINFGSNIEATIEATIEAIDQKNPRLITVRLESKGSLPLWKAIYTVGHPVQYAYHRDELAIWDAQTLFSVMPVAIEPPSAAMHLDWDNVFSLKRKGIEIAYLTHATGMSSTGDELLDAMLPVPEPYRIPDETAQVIEAARSSGRRIIAVGTGVVRALEDAASKGAGHVTAGNGTAHIKLSLQSDLKVVDGLLTGLHTSDSSHVSLLDAFVPKERLYAAYDEARRLGYLWHEFGDLNLIV